MLRDHRQRNHESESTDRTGHDYGGGADAALFLQMFPELSLAHSVRAHVEQGRPGLVTGTEPVNAEARDNDPFPSKENRDDLRWRHIRVELKIDPRPAEQQAGDIRPSSDRAEAVAHGNKVGGPAIGVNPPLQGWRTRLRRNLTGDPSLPVTKLRLETHGEQTECFRRCRGMDKPEAQAVARLPTHTAPRPMRARQIALPRLPFPWASLSPRIGCKKFRA